MLSPEKEWEVGGLNGDLDHVFPEGLILLEEKEIEGGHHIRALLTYGAKDYFSAAAEVEFDVYVNEDYEDKATTLASTKPQALRKLMQWISRTSSNSFLAFQKNSSSILLFLVVFLVL